MLTKYESVILLFAMLCPLFYCQQGRNSFRHWTFYCAVLIFILMISPNIYWLWQHDFLPFSYALSRVNNDHFLVQHVWQKHLYFPLKFVVEQIGATLPVLLLFLPFLTCQRQLQPYNSFARQFLWLMCLAPLVITLALGFIQGMWLHSLWAFPYFPFIGILLFAEYQPIISLKANRYFIILWSSYCIVLLIGRYSLLLLMPYFTQQTNAAHFPGNHIALALTREWHDTYHQPVHYIAGDHVLVANIATYSPDKPIAYFQWDPLNSPWIHEKDVYQQGAIFVWFNNTGLPPVIKQRFPQAVLRPLHIFYPLTAATVSPFQVSVAFLPPHSTMPSYLPATPQLNWDNDQ